MFRTTVMRAAHLPRAATASSALATGLRLTARTGMSTRTPTLSLMAPVVSRMSATSRYFASASASRGSPAASAAGIAEAADEVEAITKFRDLPKLGVNRELARTLTDNMRYETMTSVQAATIVPGVAGKDLVAQAKTGTGKTLAFLLPIVNKLVTDDPQLLKKRFRRGRQPSEIAAIILSPTRELAEQISVEAQKLCQNTGVVVQTAVGGTRKQAMLRKMKMEGCHILVATPGRLNDILSDSEADVSAPNLSMLVLDEADRMLETGFDQELREILRYLPDRKEKPRQTMLFSATLPKDVVSLARTYLNPANFQFVQTIDPNEQPTHEKVPQFVVSVDGYENMLPTVLEFMHREIEKSRENGTKFKAIVFLPTTVFVESVFNAYLNLPNRNRLPRVLQIHSKLTQHARTSTADRFRHSETGILFSSDVTARGIDFPNISHVIQIGLPPNQEQYIHRIGRTGRAGKSGEGWIFLEKGETSYARHLLGDLPIKTAGGLESATYDFKKLAKKSTAEGKEDGAEEDAPADAPTAVLEMTEALKYVDRSMLRELYISQFGSSIPSQLKQNMVHSLNRWAVLGWGWKEPPMISMDMAKRRGLARLRGVNIGEGRGQGSWTAESDNRSSGFSRRDEPADDFEKAFGGMEAQENRPKRFGNGGGSGGRGGFGGFSGNRDRNQNQGWQSRDSSSRFGSGRRDQGSFRGDRNDRNDRSSKGSWGDRGKRNDRNNRSDRQSRDSQFRF